MSLMTTKAMRPERKAQGLAASKPAEQHRNERPNWDEPGQFPEAHCSGRSDARRVAEIQGRSASP